MRLMLVAALLALGCAETPREYIRPGETAWQVQHRADVQCEAWLGTGGVCAYEWKSHECRCVSLTFHNGGQAPPSYSPDVTIFNACELLHRKGEI